MERWTRPKWTSLYSGKGGAAPNLYPTEHSTIYKLRWTETSGHGVVSSDKERRDEAVTFQTRCTGTSVSAGLDDNQFLYYLKQNHPWQPFEWATAGDASNKEMPASSIKRFEENQSDGRCDHQRGCRGWANRQQMQECIHVYVSRHLHRDLEWWNPIGATSSRIGPTSAWSTVTVRSGIKRSCRHRQRRTCQQRWKFAGKTNQWRPCSKMCHGFSEYPVHS